MSKVNFSEYNEVHMRRADHLVSFVKNLHHAVEKSGDKAVQAEVMHQLKCIGFDDQFVKEMCEVAKDYKHYHLERIKAEQTAKDPEVLYPAIMPERLQPYMGNRKLIEAIRNHPEVKDIYVRIQDAVAEDAQDVDANLLLSAYMEQDADAMFRAICGKYELEEVFAQAQVIPDVQELFFKKGDNEGEITFPFWGKEKISVEEFKSYILANYQIHEDTWKLIQSAIRFVMEGDVSVEKRRDCLWALLKGAIGVPEEIVYMVDLS